MKKRSRGEERFEVYVGRIRRKRGEERKSLRDRAGEKKRRSEEYR